MKKISVLKNEILNGMHDERLREIYLCDEAGLTNQKQRYVQLLDRYETLYGDEEAVIYSAPGRSEVSGNHTDHQFGKVLAASINLDAIAVVSKRGDDVIQVHSSGFEIAPVDLKVLAVQPNEAGRSESLIRGVAARLKALNYQIGGFNAVMTSNVLSGSGLSSSAAFEVLMGTILSYLYNEGAIDPVLIAQTAQYAENNYFMKPCGLMDQCACSVGGFIAIDFFDNQHPIVEKLDFDFSKTGYNLCITDTRGDHANLTDEYAAVPAEMKAVAKAMGHEVLSQCSEDEFYAALPELRKQLGDRPILRAIHLFAENKRVDELKKALHAGDINAFIDLIKASGRSSAMYLQNIYANFEANNQPVSVALAVSDHLLEGEGAWRVHGGGFAGTIQAFVKNEDVETYYNAMEHLFGEGSCYILKVRNIGGCQVLD